MAISIGTTQFGRDNTAATTLKTNIEKAFNTYSNTIKDINDITNVVRKNWAGVDADDFIKTLQAKANACANTNKKSVDKIKSAIDTDISNFAKLQSSNTGIIK